MSSIPNLAESSSPHSQSRLKVELKAEQNFFGKTIDKIVVPFKREEDMILLCLSIFLHDFVHDYNLSSMHKRVIKGESYDLFKLLGIGIRNPTFKIFSYEVGGYGEINLYDDTKFENNPIEANSNLESYSNYLYNGGLEIPITVQGGGDGNINDNREALKLFKLKPDIKKGIVEADEETESETDLESLPDSEENFFIKSAEKSVASGTGAGTDTSILEDYLTYPLTSEFTSKETYNSIIETFSKDANFLGFHSGCNNFIATYLGSNIGKEAPEFSHLFKTELGSKSEEMKNLVMFNAVLCSIDCIAADFKKFSLISSDDSLMYSFFSDVMGLLRLAFVSVFSSINKDLKTDTLIILNSSSVLYQFIIFYSLFLSCENSEKFNDILQNQSGGNGDEEDENEEEKSDKKYTVLEKTGQIETRQYQGEETTGRYYNTRHEKVKYLGSESIFITHNNLLTTIARGMFVKLGIWNKIFSSDEESMPIFGIKEMDMISYDKLLELFPTNPWNKGKPGSYNNELLIMQILILKNLLLEMSPAKTLTFGAKIDDQLKNYLDVFYNNYFVSKQQKTDKPLPKLNENALDNPDINASIGSETESMFSDPEEPDNEAHDSDEVDDEELSGGSGNGEIEMVQLNKRATISPGEIEGHVDVQGPSEQVVVVPFPNSEIIDPGRAPGMPIIFKNLKKMYQNNIYTIQNLQTSRIPTLKLQSGSDEINIYTLSELLSYNQTLMHRTDSNFNIPAPAFKFVINNAANISANINGSKMLYTKKDRDEIERIVNEVISIQDFSEALDAVTQQGISIVEKLSPLEAKVKHLINLKRQNKITIQEYNELLQLQIDIKRIRNTDLIPCENKKYLIEKVFKLNNEQLKKGDDWLRDWSRNYKWWFSQCQPFFGLYRNLVRATFCPTVSMMDAMFNCSLKLGATEPKEVGTMNFELKYESEEVDPETQKPVRVISYGGVVLNYNEATSVGVEQLNAKIDFDLVCIDKKNGVNDLANISTIGMQVADSHDLKASVVYKCIIERIREIYLMTSRIPTESDSAESVGVDVSNPETREKFLKDKIDKMWSNMQAYININNFNRLLGATSIKTFGDYLQECLACLQWGGYVNTDAEFPEHIKQFIKENNITPIYRSVSEPDKIIPYDENGNALRFGIQGDRPSGFRSNYILLNGETGINQQAISGYLYTSATQKPSRSLIVSRGSSDIETNNKTRKDGLKGKLIYVTRELPIIQEDRIRYLKSLQYKTVKEKKILVDKETGQEFFPEITEPVIQGTSLDTEYKIIKPPPDISSLEEPYKTSNYNEWDDYETPRILSKTGNKVGDFIDPQESAKTEEKARKALEKAQEKTRLDAEKTAEKTRLVSEQQGMRSEDAAAKEIRKATTEITEKHQLFAKEDKTPAEKRRYTALEKKYPGLGGSRRVKLRKGRKTIKRNKKVKKNHSLKRKISKKRKTTRR